MRAIKHHQRGMSLISIMIGMLLAMITILSSLVLYRTLSHTSIDSRIDAAIDGQFATAMLTLQLEIQSAGFGYAPSIEHVVKNGDTIYWRYKDSVDICRAFRKVVSANNTNLQLQLLKPSTCDSSSNLPTLAGWDVLSVLADVTVKSGDVLPVVTFSLPPPTSQCFPYSMSTIDWNPQQLIVDINNTARNTTATYAFCLSNTGVPISIGS